MIQPGYSMGQDLGEALVIKYTLPSSYYTKNVRTFLKHRDSVKPIRIALSKMARDMRDFALIYFSDSLAINVNGETASLSDLTHSLDFSLGWHSLNNNMRYGTPPRIKAELLKEGNVRAYNAGLCLHFPTDTLYLTQFQRRDQVILNDSEGSGPNLPRYLGFGF